MSVDVKLFDVQEPDFSQEFKKLADEGASRMKGIVQKRSRKTANGIECEVTKNSYEIFGAKKSYASWHLLEYGTGNRKNKKTGKTTGSMPPFPFVRPVAKILDSKNEEAVMKVIEKSVKLK